ncbi:MAG TPA: hypothetical protein VN285_13485 [Candidatus Deferrimicrobium sp.]|nr:hypothetical protein [Candidatus Deferrimicrobium sp.]
MSLIAGPEIWVEPARYKEYFDQSTNKIRDPGNYFDVHPALAFWKKQPGRLSLFIKKIKPENERHFAGGIGSGLLYLEDPHDNDHAHGGRIFETQSGLFEEKRREFEKLTKDSSFCEELTPSNAYGLLEAVAFRPEPQRKRSLAQNQVLTASRS